MSTLSGRELVIGVTPFGEPSARLVVAVERAGGLGVLDLGSDPARARAALAEVARWWPGTFGVRLGAGTPPVELPAAVDTVVIGAGWEGPYPNGPHRTFVEITSVADVLRARRSGAAGLIARGSEAGGRIGETSTFVLLQQLLATTDLPVWAAGGIGPHTAAAAVAGGAAGVVLDSQLAFTSESELPADVTAALRAMDGSETTVLGGHRVYVRPDLPVASLRDLTPDAVAARLGCRDLRGQLLPIGQDAPLGRALADRHVTAGGVVTAVRAAIAGHLTAAAATEPLGASSPFARTHGLAHPVAQGPMTRVSDRAGVRRRGRRRGRPAVPRARADAERPRSGRCWRRPRRCSATGRGASASSASCRRRSGTRSSRPCTTCGPPYALIAGGRPAQAAPLEDAGIATFLHVPSPGLLRPVPRRGRAPVRLRGPRVRRPRRPARQLPAVGAPGGPPAALRTPTSPTSRCSSPAASTTRARPRWWAPWPRRWPHAAPGSAC